MDSISNQHTRAWVFALLVALVVLWVLAFWYIDPKQLVETIGVENGYVFVFVLALLGGVSSLTFSSYVGTLVLLAAGGLNPYLLGVVSGLGVTLGDTAYFYLGRHGRALLKSGSLSRAIASLTHWLDHRPIWLASLVTYLYVSFTPLPNDLLAIAMGLSQRPYVPIIVPMVLGNMTHTILISLFGTQLSFLW